MVFLDEGGVSRDDLFPVELLRLRAQESILAEFGGRRPSMSEVASIPDDYLIKLSGFGPSTIRKIRLITEIGFPSSSELAGSSNAELRTKHDRLSAELNLLRDEFNRRENELQGQLNAVRRELRVRGLSST